MSDKVEELIEATTKDNKEPITFFQMFQSLWGLISVGIGAIGIFVIVTTWVFNTFPTNSDLTDKYIQKAEYYTKLKESKDLHDKEIRNANDIIEKIRKQYETDIRKLRLLYRVDRMHDLAQQLKVLDEKLKDNPSDISIKSYRDMIYNEYNRIRNKIDEGVKDAD
jgi:hypothetical protein